ncbi:MAG: hypothetical protein E7527_01500 [Ruminococcaceae bacterium]|nr:hypothetical protein [Oscillospiraceae bacterium]
MDTSKLKKESFSMLDTTCAILLALCPLLQNYQGILVDSRATILAILTPYILVRFWMQNRVKWLPVLPLLLFSVVKIVDGGTGFNELAREGLVCLFLLAAASGIINVKKLLTAMTAVAVAGSALILVQYVCYSVFDFHLQLVPTQLFLSGSDQWMGLVETGKISILGNPMKMYRPSSIFMEPSHMALYCTPVLLFLLLSPGFNKKRCALAALITVGVVASTSGLGIALCMGLWLLYFAFYCGENGSGKPIGIGKFKIKGFTLRPRTFKGIPFRGKRYGAFTFGGLTIRPINIVLILGLVVVAVLAYLCLDVVQDAVNRILGTSDGYNAVAGRTGSGTAAVAELTGTEWLFGKAVPGDEAGWYMAGFHESIYKYGLIGLVISYAFYGISLFKLKRQYSWLALMILGLSYFTNHTHGSAYMLIFCILLLGGYPTETPPGKRDWSFSFRREKRSKAPAGELQRGSTGLALKAGFWYVVSTFLVKGISFITHPIFAHQLDESSLGAFSNFASWETVLLIITSLEMQNTVARAYYDFKDDFNKYVSSVTLASCSFTLILYGIALLMGDTFTVLTSIPQQYVHVLFVMLLFQGCKQIYFAKERTLYRYKSVAVISAVNALVPTLIAVGLVAIAPAASKLDARIYGFYLPSALIGAGCFLLLFFKGRVIKWKYCKYGLVLAFPLMLHYLTAQLLTSSNSIVTTAVLGEKVNAVVSTASSANHILTTLLIAVSGAVTTWLMDNLHQEKVKAARRGTLAYTAGIAVLGIGVILLAPEVVHILGAGKYPASTTLMPGFVVAALVQSAGTIFTIMLTYQKKVVATGVATGVVAVLTVLAKYFLMKWTGSVQILPLINIAAFGVLFVINYLLVRRCGLGKYVNFKLMAGVLLVTCGFMALSYLLYESDPLRYGFIAVLGVAACVAAYRYRALLIKVVRKKFKKKKATPKLNETTEE